MKSLKEIDQLLRKLLEIQRKAFFADDSKTVANVEKRIRKLMRQRDEILENEPTETNWWYDETPPSDKVEEYVMEEM